jgi:DNA-binding MarR family transcriptional regulator
MEHSVGLRAWIRLARIFHKIQRREHTHLATFGLTLAQFDVLTQLQVKPGMTQQQLADRLLVTKGNVCGLIDRMSEQGLVERRPAPHDRRSNLLFLTENGNNLIQQVMPSHNAMIEALLAELPTDDQQHLNALLRRLDHALDVN